MSEVAYGLSEISDLLFSISTFGYNIFVNSSTIVKSKIKFYLKIPL